MPLHSSQLCQPSHHSLTPQDQEPLPPCFLLRVPCVTGQKSCRCILDQLRFTGSSPCPIPVRSNSCISDKSVTYGTGFPAPKLFLSICSCCLANHCQTYLTKDGHALWPATDSITQQPLTFQEPSFMTLQVVYCIVWLHIFSSPCIHACYHHGGGRGGGWWPASPIDSGLSHETCFSPWDVRRHDPREGFAFPLTLLWFWHLHERGHA